MNTLKLMGKLTSLAAVLATVGACGSGNPDGALSGDLSDEQSVEACLDECGVGCPAPEYLICASDGEKYCNTCVIECHGLTVADENTCQ